MQAIKSCLSHAKLGNQLVSFSHNSPNSSRTGLTLSVKHSREYYSRYPLLWEQIGLVCQDNTVLLLALLVCQAMLDPHILRISQVAVVLPACHYSIHCFYIAGRVLPRHVGKAASVAILPPKQKRRLPVLFRSLMCKHYELLIPNEAILATVISASSCSTRMARYSRSLWGQSQCPL